MQMDETLFTHFNKEVRGKIEVKVEALNSY